MHDVAVVGAGPSGGMAAWKLSEAGLDTVLLEKGERVGEPVMCGEAVSAFALENNGIPVKDDFLVRRVEGMRMLSPDGSEYTERNPGLCVRRDRFDRHIVDLAVGTGADLRLGTSVKDCSYMEGGWRLSTDDGTVSARVLVAADGPRSLIGLSQGLGVSDRMAGAAQYKFAPNDVLADDHLRFYVGKGFAGGYAWSFDRGFEVNLGVVTTGTPREKLDALCRDLGLDPDDRMAMTGGIVPQGGPNPRISGKAMVTVGDAAGLINPCSAGGVHAALHSGRVAAKHIIDALESGHPEDLGGYEREMRSSPFCEPMLMEARTILDELTDEQWNFIVKTLLERDVSRLKGMKAVSRILFNSPFTMPQVWNLRTLGKAFTSYGTWGW